MSPGPERVGCRLQPQPLEHPGRGRPFAPVLQPGFVPGALNPPLDRRTGAVRTPACGTGELLGDVVEVEKAGGMISMGLRRGRR